MGATIIIKVLLIVFLTLFVPLTAFSFYRFQLRKKEEEYTTIVKALKFDDSEAAASLLGLRSEYSAIDYALPVGFTTVLCALGTTALFLGLELKIAEAPSLLLSGIYLGSKSTGYVGYQQQSLLALTMGFIGGYTWSVQYIFRRFVTIDLPPRTYYSIGIRMILAALVALTIRHFLEATPGSEYTSGMVPVVAFLTGMFPERALHYLKARVKMFTDKPTRKADDLPLDMIEGISVFHKIRLGEVGIDNAQNLASANLIELLIRTPFKSRQMIDWIGQSKLYVCFKSDVDKLREVGIRSIVDFKIIGSVEGKLREVAQHTQISELRLTSVYQIIKDDPVVDRLLKAAKTLNIT